MTTSHGGSAADDPNDLLRELRRLRASTRRAGRSWWFPLTVFGVLVLASCPLYPASAGGPVDASVTSGPLARLVEAFGGVFTGHPAAIAVYWPVALVFGFLATGLWYRRQAERIGLRRPVLTFVVTGVAITVALIAAQYVPPLARVLFWIGLRGTAAVLVIALTLLVLARLERSWALAAIAALAVAVAVLATTYNVENLLPVAIARGDWTQATGMLLTGLVLLLAGLAAWASPRLAAPRR